MIKFLIKKIYFKIKYKAIIRTKDISLNSKLGKKTIIREYVFAGDSKVGDYCYVNRNTIIVKTRVGSFTSIGPNCIIGPNEHLYNLVTTSEILYTSKMNKKLQFTNKKNTFIGEDVWIGGNVFIKKGVNIGIGAIIAAGAVVINDVSPYSIVAGVPAKEIKKRFNEKEIELLLKSKWWNKPFHKIKKALESSEDQVDSIRCFCREISSNT